MHHLEAKLDELSQYKYHTGRGRVRLERGRHNIHKILNMWRSGWKEGVSELEKAAVYMFLGFLTFCNIFPNIAAICLGQRAYIARILGARIVTQIQWCYFLKFAFPTFRLLFHWSLERLIGALVGNTAYALAAAIPSIRVASSTSSFQNLSLGLSIAWQIGIQFGSTLWEIVEGVVTRKQMARKRRQQTQLDWPTIDSSIEHELTSLASFLQQPCGIGSTARTDAEDVPLRVRIERFLQYSNIVKLGRSADMLVGLLKNDLENIVKLYEDYRDAAGTSELNTISDADAGHVEPRLPKYLYVLLECTLFAYICYSYWFEPFTFNTATAFAVVVVLRQLIAATKRYQTVQAAQRVFTNMAASSVWGIFLVSVPLILDGDIFQNDVAFAGLTIALTILTMFFTEPLAPLFRSAAECLIAVSVRSYERCRTMYTWRRAKDVSASDDSCSSTDTVIAKCKS